MNDTRLESASDLGSGVYKGGSLNPQICRISESMTRRLVRLQIENRGPLTPLGRDRNGRPKRLGLENLVEIGQPSVETERGFEKKNPIANRVTGS